MIATMHYLELITLVLDFVGMILVSCFLFKIPDKVEFRFTSNRGIITDLSPVAEAINSTLPSALMFSLMRWGLRFLVISMALKFLVFFT